MIKDGKMHVDFCAMLYRIQHENGMYFLHEHPYNATSWGLPSMKGIMELQGVQKVKRGVRNRTPLVILALELIL